MASLKAVMALMTGGFSSGINKVIRETDTATYKILKACGAADNFNEKLESMGASVNNVSDKFSNASGVTDAFNNKLEATGTSTNIANTGLARMVRTLISLAALKKGMDISDEYMNTAARLNLINDGLQTQAELQDKIFVAAKRSRGAYSDMANAVAKMGLLASGAFTSNDELIAFTELIQKSFKVGGASQSEQSSAMLQLTQAMAAGKLQGDEFRSIMENAPMIADAISKYIGKSKGKLKELAAEGQITSDIIKNAVFMASNDINAKFEKMPRTFGDIWNSIKNGALQAFDKVISKVNALINTDIFQKFVDNLIVGFNLAASAISWLIDVFVNGWDVIGPILAAIAGIWLATIIVKLWAMVPPLVAQAAAWLSIYWPIILVIGIIGVAIAAARQLGATWDEIIGLIGGIIGVFATYFYNQFIRMWNQVAAFINFFGNVFRDPIASIKVLFLDLAVNVIGYIQKMAQALQDFLNNIPFLKNKFSFADKILSLRDNLSAKAAEIRTEADLKTYVQSKEFMDFTEGFEKGSQIGKNLVSKIQNAFDLSEYVSSTADFDLGQFGTSQNPVNVEGKVKLSDEDLKYLREIAERDYINKFSTATLAPNVTFNFGDIHETADIEKIRGKLEEIIREEIATAAEGSYQA